MEKAWKSDKMIDKLYRAAAVVLYKTYEKEDTTFTHVYDYEKPIDLNNMRNPETNHHFWLFPDDENVERTTQLTYGNMFTTYTLLQPIKLLDMSKVQTIKFLLQNGVDFKPSVTDHDIPSFNIQTKEDGEYVTRSNASAEMDDIVSTNIRAVIDQELADENIVGWYIPALPRTGKENEYVPSEVCIFASDKSFLDFVSEKEWKVNIPRKGPKPDMERDGRPRKLSFEG